MPFRARIKQAFSRSSVSEEGADLTQVASKASKKEKKQKTPDNVYKFGEVMPKAKYRGPVNQEHQEKLQAFNFSNAFGRRNSEQSQYSPFGSKFPSRRGSFLSRLSLGPKSGQHSQAGTGTTVVESAAGDDDVTNGDHHPWKAKVYHKLMSRSGSFKTTDERRRSPTENTWHHHNGPAEGGTDGHEWPQ